MKYPERKGNVYCIDAKMFGFDNYMSVFLVKGKELALIDTGVPAYYEAVRSGIKSHGFSLSDISYIFITHEHRDHTGNVAKVLKESPRANVYIHPRAEIFLTDPSIDDRKRKAVLTPKFNARWAGMEPTPPSRIRFLNDGDVFDLGDDETLKVIYAPGHQPGGLVLYQPKSKGLFINDLVGNYFPDAGAHAVLSPINSDLMQGMDSMKKLMDLPIDNLYLGHYGIVSENPKQVMEQTLRKMQELLEIGKSCMREGKPEKIEGKLREYFTPYLESMRKARGEEIYQYASQEHFPFLVKGFTMYFEKKFKIV